MLNEMKKLKDEFLKQTTKEFRHKVLKIAAGTTIAACAVGTIVPAVIENVQSKKEAEQHEKELWEEAVNNSRQRTVQAEKLDIKFNPLSTSENVYKTMEETVVDLADRAQNFEGLAGVGSQVVVMGEKIPADAFVTVDNEAKEQSTENNIEEIEGLQLVGNLYLRDAYIGKFMSSDGTFGSIVAQLQGDKLYVAPRLAFENKVETEIITDKSENDVITEEVYLSDIYKIMMTVYSQSWSDALLREEALDLVNKYFTEDCKNTLLNQAEGVDRQTIKSVEPGFISVGTSDIQENTIDRVYVQLEMDTKGNKDGYVDFELKLNSNNKIYDIDIL